MLGGFLVPVGSLLLLALSQGDPTLGRGFYTYGFNSFFVGVVAAGICALVAVILGLCPTIAPRTLAEHRCAFSDLGLCPTRYGIGRWSVAAYDSS